MGFRAGGRGTPAAGTTAFGTVGFFVRVPVDVENWGGLGTTTAVPDGAPTGMGCRVVVRGAGFLMRMAPCSGMDEDREGLFGSLGGVAMAW